MMDDVIRKLVAEAEALIEGDDRTSKVVQRLGQIREEIRKAKEQGHDCTGQSIVQFTDITDRKEPA